MSKLSAIILTYNESQHIERAVASVLPIAERVFVVDSGSTDGTPEIAERLGCTVLHNPWTNYATQVNWSLDHCPVTTPWVLRLDADEYVTEPLRAELARVLDDVPDSVYALRVPRRMHFMGRWVKHGGVGERLMLRIWRHPHGRAEQRWMDEHIVVDRGEAIDLTHPIVDDNLNSLTWWTTKHNTYASREAIDQLLRFHGKPGEADDDSSKVSGQAARIRFYKERIYYVLPPIVRGGFYFFIRYVLQLGFLDGVSGTYFHFLQGWWYRTLVDAKIHEVRRYRSTHGVSLEEAIERVLGFKV